MALPLLVSLMWWCVNRLNFERNEKRNAEICVSEIVIVTIELFAVAYLFQFIARVYSSCRQIDNCMQIGHHRSETVTKTDDYETGEMTRGHHHSLTSLSIAANFSVWNGRQLVDLKHFRIPRGTPGTHRAFWCHMRRLTTAPRIASVSTFRDCSPWPTAEFPFHSTPSSSDTVPRQSPIQFGRRIWWPCSRRWFEDLEKCWTQSISIMRVLIFVGDFFCLRISWTVARIFLTDSWCPVWAHFATF